MSAALDRGLTWAYRAVGGLLFLALCGHLAYAAGDRSRSWRVRAGLVQGAGLGVERPAPRHRNDPR